MVKQYLPHFACGVVTEGFGRGSKALGCPTANFPQAVVKALPPDFPLGVYYGWAQVDDGEVHKMVMNIGMCPFYQNKEKSMETHIIHQFEKDFYGSQLKIVIVGYLRPELNFTTIDNLIATIKNDIENAKEALDSEESLVFRTNDFFS